MFIFYFILLGMKERGGNISENYLNYQFIENKLAMTTAVSFIMWRKRFKGSNFQA